MQDRKDFPKWTLLHLSVSSTNTPCFSYALTLCHRLLQGKKIERSGAPALVAAELHPTNPLDSDPEADCRWQSIETLYLTPLILLCCLRLHDCRPLTRISTCSDRQGTV